MRAGAVIALGGTLLVGGACDTQVNLLPDGEVASSDWTGVSGLQQNARAGEKSPQQDSEGLNGGSSSSPDDPDDSAEGQFVPGRLLVKFRAGSAMGDEDRILGAAGARVSGEIPGIGVKIVELPPQASATAQARAFGQQANVEFAELDRLAAPAMTPNDYYYSYEWHLSKIGAPAAWDRTTGDSGVIIAILDTGVNTAHADLSSKCVPGWNVYDNNSNTTDVNGHGTAVAGAAAAASNNSVGVASVAWGCRIMPIRIADSNGYASTSAVAIGLTWAADHGARVANISFAPVSSSSTISTAANYFRAARGIVMVSSGNSGNFDTSVDNPSLLTISATDQSDLVPSWSTVGNNLDLSAPGTGIFTTGISGGYVSGTGTSFSSPVVAGVAALVMSANPGLSPQEVEGVLKQSADDLGPASWDSTYGWGRVNAGRAVERAGVTVAPPADTMPPTVSFTTPTNGASVSGTVAVTVGASDNVGVVTVSFFVNGSLMGSDTTAPYSFAWNTTGLQNGSHALDVRAVDAAGNSSSATAGVSVANLVDTTSPTVVITSPAQGARVSRTVSVAVSASDNVAVVRVELYVDGGIKGSSVTAPFTISWNPRKASAGAHTLQCKAYDAAGNLGQSPTVTVYK